MMKVEIREATLDDIPHLAARMRQSDRDEVAASTGHTAEEALTSSLLGSTQTWTGLIDGEPVCMFGVGPLSVLAGRGAPWMLGTDTLERWPRTFLRRCRPCVAAMLSVYPWLENYVDERNTLSKKWLAWLGFTLAEEPVTLVNGARFRHFEMKLARAGHG